MSVRYAHDCAHSRSRQCSLKLAYNAATADVFGAFTKNEYYYKRIAAQPG